MAQSYNEILDKLNDNYDNNYSKKNTSTALADGIKDIVIADIICLLKEIRDVTTLRKLSISLSRRSHLFDKLVLIKVEATHAWALRLHTYKMVGSSEKAGYVKSNLGRETMDLNIHKHSWQLASKILMGGFRNYQYVEDEKGTEFFRCNLVSTARDNVSNKYYFRKAEIEGVVGILKINDDFYQQGDLVHYPIETPHSVDSNGIAPYVGMTITLAHTSERHHKNSIFYKKKQVEQLFSENSELAVESQCYTEQEHSEAINVAITRLQLLMLSDKLASHGFKRFNRFIDPITRNTCPNNVVETELLPTIAMLKLQKDLFIECPMIAVLKGIPKNISQELTDKCAESSVDLINIINHEIDLMDEDSLNILIEESQINLLSNLYTESFETLDEDAKQALLDRQYIEPNNVVNFLIS